MSILAEGSWVGQLTRCMYWYVPVLKWGLIGIPQLYNQLQSTDLFQWMQRCPGDVCREPEDSEYPCNFPEGCYHPSHQHRAHLEGVQHL